MTAKSRRRHPRKSSVNLRRCETETRASRLSSCQSNQSNWRQQSALVISILLNSLQHLNAMFTHVWLNSDKLNHSSVWHKAPCRRVIANYHTSIHWQSLCTVAYSEMRIGWCAYFTLGLAYSVHLFLFVNFFHSRPPVYARADMKAAWRYFCYLPYHTR